MNVSAREVASALIGFGAFLALLSCRASESHLASVEVRDSAGIRIVTNHQPADPSPLTVHAVPTVEIGNDESDTTQIVFRVAAAFASGNHRIIVANSAAPMLRWYDHAGRYLLGTGRPGGGPGEFGPGEGARVSTIWPLPADSVATWEHAPRRMQVFDEAGRFARAVVLDLPDNMPPASYPQLVGPLDAGFVTFVADVMTPGVVGEIVRDSIPYVRYRADGSYAGVIRRLPGYTMFTMVVHLPDGTQQKTMGRPPFAALPAAWAHADALVYGAADRYEYTVYDTTGEVRSIVRKSVETRPVTADLIEAHKAETMAGAPTDPAARRRWEEAIDAAPFPESIPAYRRLRVDRSGNVWVQDYNLPGADSVTWSVFDSDGRWQNDLRIPIEWQVLDLGMDHMLVLVRNELDVEIIRRYEIER